MANTPKSEEPKVETEATQYSNDTQKRNFENAAKTAQINHDRHEAANVSGGYDGVEVREARNVEVINPVRDSLTGELTDDTRTLKQSDEEVVGADQGSKDA